MSPEETEVIHLMIGYAVQPPTAQPRRCDVAHSESLFAVRTVQSIGETQRLALPFLLPNRDSDRYLA